MVNRLFILMHERFISVPRVSRNLPHVRYNSVLLNFSS